MDRQFDGCECHRFCVLEFFPDDLELFRRRLNGHAHRSFEIGHYDLAKAFGPEPFVNRNLSEPRARRGTENYIRRA